MNAKSKSGNRASRKSEPTASPLSRRQFGFLAAAAPLAFKSGRCSTPPPYEGGLTDIPGLKVGHFNLTKRPTGCTVILAEAGATAGVDVRGSAPGTRETDLLAPHNSVQKIHAVMLSGGSAFGLDAATGAVQYLEEKKVGIDTGAARVPIVPAAVLYDLSLGSPSLRPDRHTGYRACLAASGGPVAEGNVGAGTGATVGKVFGGSLAMKGGIGSASIQLGGLIVAALVAVNATGDIIDPHTGQIVAGARKPDGSGFLNIAQTLRTRAPREWLQSGQNTTLGVVASNTRLDKAQTHKVAQMAHDGLARSINPAHTPADGDTIFALSLGENPANLTHVGALAAEVTSRAIVRAVLMATSLTHYPAACDLSF